MRYFYTVILLSICASYLGAQNINESWQVGVGFSITKFNSSDASFIGDEHMIQIPRVNLSMPVGERFAVDVAFSFNHGDISFNVFDENGLISNSVEYYSMDASFRYNFDPLLDRFGPYVFIGGSAVDTTRKMTPTLNFGAGGIYWITRNIGINPQVYYKHSFEGYESMRSHFQGTLGFVFKLNWNNIFNNRGHSASSARSISGSCFR